MECSENTYTLPTIDFVGGETQNLVFHVYHYKSRNPFSLGGCSCNFSAVSFADRAGSPVLNKSMSSSFSDESAADNVLTVTLTPAETVNLSGKYLYQITIRDAEGNTEIPKQGVMYITNNINKSFIGQ